jgi:methionine sulfoxide reductase heme-binding subunit
MNFMLSLKQFGSFIMPLHTWLVMRKKFIERVFFGFEIAIVLMWFVAAYLLSTEFDIWLVALYEVGSELGPIALCFYLLTLIPGITQRLQVALPIGVLLNTFRRHFGVTMFLTALLHMSLTTALPNLVQGGLPVLMTPQWFGFFAVLTLFPMWLTSNDASQKFLGKRWKTLHRLTYLALLLIFGHVTLMLSNWRWIAGVILLLEILSWIVAWYKLLSKKNAVVAQTAAQEGSV